MKREDTDTGTIDLNAPVPVGFGRIAFDAECGASGFRQPRSFSILQMNDLERSTWLFNDGERAAAEADKSSVADLLASLSFVSANTMRNVTAAACVQWMNLLGPEKSTRSINPTTYSQFALRFSMVSVSPKLRTERNLLPRTAFFAPSGAQLTWAEVVAESDNGGR